MFDTHKTRMIGLPCGEEIVTMLSRVDTTPERDGQIDGWTDRQTGLMALIIQKQDKNVCKTELVQ